MKLALILYVSSISLLLGGVGMLGMLKTEAIQKSFVFKERWGDADATEFYLTILYGDTEYFPATKT